jgi:hypothetical protein
MDEGSESIQPAEILYRRIPAVWATSPFPSPLAFTPRPEDIEGLSVYRAKYCRSIEEIALNPRGAVYCVASLLAKDLMDAGIAIIPSPDRTNNKPGHAHLPAINYHQRKAPEVVNFISLLATKLSTVHGPFPGTPAETGPTSS